MAGSGKSYILLLDVIRYIGDPDFRGVIFRRLTGDITKPGGLWDEAKDLWSQFGCVFRETTLTATFPSGAWIKFSHMEKESNKGDWKGSQLTYVAFDEVADFTESQVIFMISRMRSKSKYKPFMRMTCNPEYSDHWLYKFVKPYLDPNTGIPDRSKSGVKQYMLNLDGHIEFNENLADLHKKYGTGIQPKTFSFIAGNCFDNKELLRVNPEYLSNLLALDRVQRERMLLGSWHAALEGCGFFSREHIEFVAPREVPRRLRTIRCWDLAVSEVSEVNPNPDYTASVKMSLCDDGYFYVEHCSKFRHGPNLVQKKIMETAKNDGRNIPVGIPLDPGAQGVVAYETWAKPLILGGHIVKKLKTRKGKLERFMGFANASENGLVKIVRGDWNDEFFAQLELFDGSGKTKDDIVDSCSDSYNWLISGKKLPEKFSLNPSTLTRINQLANF